MACGRGAVAMATQSPTGARWGKRGGRTSTRGDLMYCPAHTHTHTHTHKHVASDQDYERESVQGPTYKVMESRAGDIRGRATLTGVNKITVDAAGRGKRLCKHNSNVKRQTDPS